MSLKRALPREKYLSLQRDLQKKGVLYEDRDFPPVSRSLFTKTRPSVSLQWKRPKVRVSYTYIMHTSTFLSSVLGVICLALRGYVYTGPAQNSSGPRPDWIRPVYLATFILQTCDQTESVACSKTGRSRRTRDCSSLGQDHF